MQSYLRHYLYLMEPGVDVGLTVAFAYEATGCYRAPGTVREDKDTVDTSASEQLTFY